MKNPKSVLLPLLVLVIAGGAFWLLNDDGGVHQTAGADLEESATETRSDPAKLADLAEDQRDSAAGRERSQVEATSTFTSETREVAVQVAIPFGAPADDTLQVVALEASALDNQTISDFLMNSEAPLASAPVSTNGMATLALPTEGDLIVGIDGKFLFLNDSYEVSGSESEIRLEPELGAYITGEFQDASTTPQGRVSLMGMNFSGGRGFASRAIDLASAEFEIRGVDTDFTWTLVPELRSAFADMRMGIELDPGEENSVQLSVMTGVTLRGKVTDEEGNPLEKVRVQLANEQPWMPVPETSRARTDAEGRYELTGLPPGKLSIEAEQDGLLDAQTERMELADGEVKEDVNLVLTLGSIIEGFVRYPDGSPAAGASVSAEMLQRQNWGGWGGTRRRTVGRDKTEADGSFRITGLAGDKFTLRAEHQQEETDETWRASLDNVAADSKDVELTLGGPVLFAGKVVDDRGEPVTKFTIRMRSAEDGGPNESAEFDSEDGTFTFRKAVEGEWNLTARAEGHTQQEDILVKLPVQEQPVLVTLQRTASVAGRVVDSTGAPMVGATIRASTGSEEANPWMGPRGPSTESGADGVFELTDLAPGTLELTASAQDWADSLPLSIQLEPGARREDVTLSLRIGGTILGTVLTPEGDPLSGRRVTWGRNSMGFSSNGETSSGSDGTFTFQHVTPGDWVVTASPSMEEMGERMRNGDGESAWVEVMGQLITESITIGDGETIEIFLGGEPRIPVRITGIVTKGGEPVEDARVYAVSEDSAVFQGMKSVQTDADGAYTLEVDRPGAYVMTARSGRAGVEKLTDIPRKEEAHVDIAIPVGMIEGVIEKPDGTLAKGIRMQIQREDGLGRMRWDGTQATSNEEGYYSFEGLEEGRYTIRANISGWNGRADERFGTSIAGGIEVDKDSVTTGVDFELTKAGSVEGFVESEDGTPVSGASIFFRDAAGRMVTTISGTTTNAAGRFKKTGLSPGDYTLSVRASEGAASDQAAVRVSSTQAVEARLVIETGTRIQIKLEDEGGLAQRARVEVFDESGREVGGLMTQQDMQRMFNEGSSSIEREVGPLPSGRYTVRATTSDGRSKEKKVRLNGRRATKTVRLKLES